MMRVATPYWLVPVGSITFGVLLPTALLVPVAIEGWGSPMPWGAVWQVEVLTLRLGVYASAVTLVAAFLLAVATRQWSARAIAGVIVLIGASAAVQTTFRAVYLQRLLGLGENILGQSLAFGEAAVVSGLVFYLLPFAVSPLIVAVRRIDPESEHVAELAGSSGLGLIWHVYLRPLTPAIGALWVLCFTLAVGAYITPTILGSINDITASRYLGALLSEGRAQEAATVALLTAMAPLALLGILLCVGATTRSVRTRD